MRKFRMLSILRKLDMIHFASMKTWESHEDVGNTRDIYLSFFGFRTLFPFRLRKCLNEKNLENVDIREWIHLENSLPKRETMIRKKLTSEWKNSKCCSVWENWTWFIPPLRYMKTWEAHETFEGIERHGEDTRHKWGNACTAKCCSA